MFKKLGWMTLAAVGGAWMLAGCASTKVVTDSQYVGILQRPEQIFVYNFAVTPGEVELGTGLAAKIEDLAKKQSRTEQEIAVGRAVSDALAKKLVTQMQSLGFASDRASGAPPSSGTTLAIKGQFVSIDEGNSTEREVIGLGLGRTKVKSIVQAYLYRNGQAPVLVCQYEVDAQSGRKPGMAESMGVGAVSGHLVTAAAVGAGGAVVSEEFSATVEADADRTAKDITKKLKDFFAGQGWIVKY
jgi:hypothetical protein